MACSVCRENGHKKPNCPIVKEENERNIDRAIDLIQTTLPLISHPLIIAGIWLILTKLSPRINVLNNLIAVGELVPTIDLGLPKGVVLGAMIDKTDDAIELWNTIRDFIEDYELPAFPSSEELKDEYIDEPLAGWWERQKGILLSSITGVFGKAVN